MREITVDLPHPPSVNSIWRRGKGRTYSSEGYTKWKREADGFVMAQKPRGGFKRIDGPFSAEIVIRRARGDIDNRVKVLLDAAQKYGLIEDDKHCEGLTIRYGEAPHGCRLILREIGETKCA